MNFLKSLLLLLFLCLISCNKNTVFSKFDKDFTDNRWQKTDVKSYEFTISNVSKSYDLIFEFSHVAETSFDKIPLKFEITNPDQTKEIIYIPLKTKDAKGNDLGDCSGDYCDLAQSVFEGKKLSAGSYKVTVANEFNNPYLPNVLGVGIKVNTSEK